jgi:hypothetical protein
VINKYSKIVRNSTFELINLWTKCQNNHQNVKKSKGGWHVHVWGKQVMPGKKLPVFTGWFPLRGRSNEMKMKREKCKKMQKKRIFVEL